MSQTDSTTRFLDRAGYYASHRPRYPAEVIDLLLEEAGWTPEATVVDVGSGTGISSELFLERGNTVIAVEPNPDMRRAAERRLGANLKFRSIDGKAEATTLRSTCADFVVCATAFHWFDVEACRHEFRRILKPQRVVVLMWNKRRSETSPVLEAYETLLRQYGKDYESRWRKQSANLEESVRRFFEPALFQKRSFDNSQRLDFDGLRGRFLSSSYTPLPGEPLYEPAIRELESLFERFAVAGAVTLEYDTQIYWGRF